MALNKNELKDLLTTALTEAQAPPSGLPGEDDAPLTDSDVAQINADQTEKLAEAISTTVIDYFVANTETEVNQIVDAMVNVFVSTWIPVPMDGGAVLKATMTATLAPLLTTNVPPVVDPARSGKPKNTIK